MPAAIPIIATAAASAAGAAAAGASLAAIAAVTALSVGLGLLSQALAPKPKNSSFASEAFDRTQQVRQPAPPRRVLYGEVKISGSFALAENSSDKQYLHIALMVATHEVQEIGTVYLNDDPIFSSDIDVNGNVVSGQICLCCSHTKYFLMTIFHTQPISLRVRLLT